MRVTGVFLRSRQVLAALLVLTASGTLIALGGDLHMPVPGAEVPIVLGTLAPLLSTWAVLSCADGAYRWAEDLAPRDLARPRTALLGVMSLLASALIMLLGLVSIGARTASALVCGFAVLTGIGTLGWVLAGRGGGFVLPLVFTLVCMSFGTTSADHGVAPWALLLVEPGAPAAVTGAVIGMVVAGVGWWTRDRAVRCLERGSRVLARARLGA